jgi:uncharacterized alkaline shock family protein YloU
VSDELLLREADGTITVPAATLERLVAAAAERVDGVRVRRPRRSVDVLIADGQATVTLHLAARYGTVLPMVAEAVQREVGSALSQMCALEVGRIDVAVEELV